MLVYIASIDPEPMAGFFFKLTRPNDKSQWGIKIIQLFRQKVCYKIFWSQLCCIECEFGPLLMRPDIISHTNLMFHGEMHDNIIMRKDKNKFCAAAQKAFGLLQAKKSQKWASGQNDLAAAQIFFCPSSWWYCRAFLHETLHLMSFFFGSNLFL